MDAVILCGGGSRRMGRNKAFLPVGGRPLIDRQIALLQRVFDGVLLVTRSPGEYAHLGLPLVEDARPEHGSIVGIFSGLRAVDGRAAFFVACDMPFLNEGLLRFMAQRADCHDVVIPESPKGLEPTHAVYSKACLAPMAAQMDRGDLKIINFFPHVKVSIITQREVRHFDPLGLCLINVNTQAEFEELSAFSDGRNIQRLRGL